MRITSFTDFGLRTLIYLGALPSGQLSSITEVSALYDASHNHMTKVIGQLRKCGYVKALRGKGGGICLALPAEQIRIGEVMRALEVHLDGVDCSTTECRLLPHCKLKQAIKKGMESFFNTMNEYTLADIVEDKLQLHNLLEISD